MGEEFSEPRTGKRGEVVMDQSVELWGPLCCLVVAVVILFLKTDYYAG